MKRLANALIFFGCFGIGGSAFIPRNVDAVYDFENIVPSTNITWKSCFGTFKCSRLQVPLDYANPSIGTTSIAFIKISGKNATAKSPSIVVIPGGPGNSGVDLLLTSMTTATQAFGEQYNIVSFDPRGVNNSGPRLDCFAGKSEARLAFAKLHNTGTINISSTIFQEQYYSSSIYGEYCNHAVKTGSLHGYYVTTPTVARDLLSFIEADAVAIGRSPSEAKLWTYGISYGTVIGATFASMFPNRVERMILDGIVNADLYYQNKYTANVDQMDTAISNFSSLCYSAGLKKCSFWGPSPANITARLNSIILQLLTHPVPISRVRGQGLPSMATYSDLKALLLNSIYTPIAQFPVMADVLHQVEQGRASALSGLFERSVIQGDANHVIQCSDASRTNSFTTIEAFQGYVEYTIKKSRYIGDIYPIFVDSILCRSFRTHLPASMLINDTKIGLDKPTPFPIVFASNTIDPITPLISAEISSSRFPGSVLLLQEGIGHTVINQGASDCYFKHVQAYYQGKSPPSKTLCSQQYIPFMDSPP